MLLLRVAAEAGVSPLPDAWVESVRRSLRDADADFATQAVAVARATGEDRFDAELTSIARDGDRPVELRLAALSAMLPRAKRVDTPDFEFLTAALVKTTPPLTRLRAAQALAAAPLDDVQLARLAVFLSGAGPMELPALLPAFERSADPIVGAALVKSLDASKSLESVSPAALTQAVARFSPDVRDAAAKLVAKINPDAEAQQARLAELEPLLTGGSANRGQSVFFGKASACATCHAVRGTGAHVGPDLSKIAGIRTGRDLLESVVFPSASFARGYEPFVVQTKAGQTHAGTLAAETADAIVLRTPAEVRIPRAAVKTIRQDRVSTMPQGLEASLSREDLADLMAFLQSLK
jgi:putative heme-binding domain-containing protein